MIYPNSILVVDDDENLAQTLGILLRGHGYWVATASNGVDGYRKYLSHPTEVVIADIQMPAMNGFEMMGCIRAINPGVRTIYLSGGLDRYRDHVDSEGREFNVASLLKPISTEVLLEILSNDVGSAQPSGPMKVQCT
jgi:YesN/AraC family two-component response regulator